MSVIFDSQLQERQPLACVMFETAVSRGRLAPAYLLVGRAQEDKGQLARQLSMYLNCTDADKQLKGSCGLKIAHGYPVQPCSNCRWIADEAHPQAWIVLSGDDSKSGRISVEKARQLSQELSKTSVYARLVLIPQAAQDVLHRPAANALLKTMEEPGPNCLFILLASQPDEVLATIVSRCQLIPLPQSASLGLWVSDGPDQQKSQRVADQLKKDNPVDFLSPRLATATLSSTWQWARYLLEIAEAEDSPALVLDQIVSQELKALRDNAADDPALLCYLSRLLGLAEAAKEQIEHYVQLKAALESFALGCRQLSQQLAEAGLAN